MSEDYRPNVKNLELFGQEDGGYKKELVDKYIGRLEETYRKATTIISQLKDEDSKNKDRIAELESDNDNISYDDIAELEILRSKNIELTSKNSELTSRLREVSLKGAGQEDKILLADVMIDARKSAEMIIDNAKSKAAQMESNSRREMQQVLDEKQQLIDEVKKTYDKFRSFVADLDDDYSPMR